MNQLTELNARFTYLERCQRSATSYLNDINSLECMNFCNDKAYWARITASGWQVEINDMLAIANKIK